MIVFVLQAVVVLIAPFFPDQIVRFSILVVNVIVSVLLGWRLYKSLYHMVFSYDNEGFTLKKGRKEVNSHKWSEFSKVSLFRTESGELSVRLYHDSEHFDLPASKLKLNPFTFRQEVMQLVSSSKGKK
jgi:hypothetical protein